MTSSPVAGRLIFICRDFEHGLRSKLSCICLRPTRDLYIMGRKYIPINHYSLSPENLYHMVGLIISILGILTLGNCFPPCLLQNAPASMGNQTNNKHQLTICKVCLDLGATTFIDFRNHDVSLGSLISSCHTRLRLNIT